MRPVKSIILLLALSMFGCRPLNAAPHPTPPDARINVLAFTAPWCLPCRRQHPTLEKYKDDGLRVYEFNVDVNVLMSKKYDIKVVPTYVVRDGQKELWRTHNVYELKALTK